MRSHHHNLMVEQILRRHQRDCDLPGCALLFETAIPGQEYHNINTYIVQPLCGAFIVFKLLRHTQELEISINFVYNLLIFVTSTNLSILKELSLYSYII